MNLLRIVEVLFGLSAMLLGIAIFISGDKVSGFLGMILGVLVLKD